MQESWRTRARVPIRPRDDDRRFHQASGAWKTENGDGHAKWWLSEPVELLAVTENHLFERADIPFKVVPSASANG